MDSTIVPPEGGLLGELRQICQLERDLGTELGLEAVPASAHPGLIAARAAISGSPSEEEPRIIFAADGIKSAATIPWDRLEERQFESDDALELVRYVVIELVRNVEEHSRAESGASVRVAHRSHPTRIAIGVADRGVGVRRSLEQFHHPPDDRSAVTLAVAPGVSGATSRAGGNQVNAGAGLFFARGIAALSGLSFLLLSGSAAWHLEPETVDTLSLHNGEVVALGHSRWDGTVALVDLPTAPRYSRDDFFSKLQDAYFRHVKDAKKEFDRRRSLVGEAFFRNR